MEVVKIPIDELKPFVRNPKLHPERQINSIKKSFKEFGWTNPILIAEDNMVVAGHARLIAAKELGFMEVPVIKLEMSYEKAVAYVVADNKTAELGSTDFPMLQELLREIAELEDFDIESIGYSESEIDALLNVPVYSTSGTGSGSGSAAGGKPAGEVDIDDEWTGMPAFESENLDPAYSLKVNFASLEDLMEFAKLVDQKITEKTPSIWYPAQGSREGKKFGIYEDESEEMDAD